MENQKQNKKTNNKSPITIEGVDCKLLENQFVLVKVGQGDKPADQKYLDDVSNSLSEIAEKNKLNCIFFVTHQFVNMEIVR